MLPQNWLVIGVGGLALLLGGIANYEVFGLLALFLYCLVLGIMIYFIITIVIIIIITISYHLYTFWIYSRLECCIFLINIL